ncbi:hypothetical protein E2C01_016605 [Portunus trituberculatus]|uniref:Uncharacterized protein n=1 Tax=Portunus trituberculatus TaxID=210409 RepID=A0A5B7DPV3_PORTR|nr:hypothetical protein [Portunus trituberculatus]
MAALTHLSGHNWLHPPQVFSPGVERVSALIPNDSELDVQRYFLHRLVVGRASPALPHPPLPFSWLNHRAPTLGSQSGELALSVKRFITDSLLRLPGTEPKRGRGNGEEERREERKRGRGNCKYEVP